jgi:hypothetical protein
MPQKKVFIESCNEPLIREHPRRESTGKADQVIQVHGLGDDGGCTMKITLTNVWLNYHWRSSVRSCKTLVWIYLTVEKWSLRLIGWSLKFQLLQINRKACFFNFSNTGVSEALDRYEAEWKL